MSTRDRAKGRPTGAVHGVLVVDKPAGMTSHDVVSRARRAFGTRRVGHAGTLDPMATGVLVVLFGEATKLSSVLTTDRKAYDARVQFGSATDSGDADGKVIKTCHLQADWLDTVRLLEALDLERARRLQMPPQVSAIKIAGVRSYTKARRGESVELSPRDVVVHTLELIHHGASHIDLRILVSKGYYVRSLARDLGASLGVPAHLASLRRTHSGRFGLDGACDFPLTGDEPLAQVAQVAREHLPVVNVNSEGALRIQQGKRLRASDLLAGPAPPLAQTLAAFSDEILLALVEPCENSEFRVKRGLNLGEFPSSGLPPGETVG